MAADSAPDTAPLLLRLPQELLKLVISRLPPTEIVSSVGATCSALYTEAASDELWHDLLRSHYATVPRSPLPPARSAPAKARPCGPLSHAPLRHAAFAPAGPKFLFSRRFHD